ncbi:hypothetical protein E4N62_26270 [Streptomyces sp. MNU76]|uniref:hypothetical protein n=1 Tax=Streptomyces sp. MNU76 TaxID=2560026 RepID=UPI001E54D07A|nr:hypothetical protein [Streptomyces sp. MNU76]MCC9707221.1 hypothetical protein [Streptomyces sp. MNU76]MCC9708459.1 hypothetical protein [Streptomyces sp. MNU76]
MSSLDQAREDLIFPLRTQNSACMDMVPIFTPASYIRYVRETVVHLVFAVPDRSRLFSGSPQT